MLSGPVPPSSRQVGCRIFCRLAPIDSLRVAGRQIIVGVSGGSGARLGKRFVELALTSADLATLHLVVSDSALRVARSEIAPDIASPADWIAHLEAPREFRRRLLLHDNADVGAPIASGSHPFAAMIVVPCSGGTLGSIAHGIARDLLQRSADVCLKERRPLVLALRESPYSLVHIENMRAVTLAGAIVAPPAPAFYVEAPSVDRFLDAYCVRLARLAGLPPRGDEFRWQPPRPTTPRLRGRAAGKPTPAGPRPGRKARRRKTRGHEDEPGGGARRTPPLIR
jgi:4-hydroxy-3-polyprenylbenzoate decarboxylase